MLLQILVITGCLKVFSVLAHDVSVVRHTDGDIFTVEGYCVNACTDVSSGTASPYNHHLSMTVNTNTTCICQCNSGLPLFREDLNICVSDIYECSNVAGFLSGSGVVEKVPYVFLPQRGQIVYPQAEILFEDVKTPVCGIAGSQQLGKNGWTEFKNLSSVEPPFKIFRDEGRTFLQWNGESGLRDTAEGKVVVARLVCRDASPKTTSPGVFSPCVTFRVAGSPSKTNIREVTFASAIQPNHGLSTIEYTAIGISAILLALIYVASVSLYLHSRKARRKHPEDPPEIVITGGRDGGSGLIKNNPLLTTTRHFESDTNSGLSESDQGDEFSPSDNEQSFEKITSAIVHPQHIFTEQTEGPFGTSIIAEKLPEEDVRIVETIDNTTLQQDMPVLPGTQRRKLYFNPAYFERQLLIAPPPAAIEFLLKIREVISIAKHKMSAKKFVPTLSGIPEEETASERCASVNKPAPSIQESIARSRKSQRCTGCPGCMETRSSLPAIFPDNSRPSTGDSRVRAWLEDVKPPEKRYNIEDNQKNFHENIRTFSRSLEHLADNRNHYMNIEHSNSGAKSLASWKENPPMLRTFQNIARSEILGDDDRHSVSRQSTKSMFEDTNYDRFCRTRRRTLEIATIGPDNEINSKVRKAIENSFIKQMEESAALENQINDNNHFNQTERRFSPDGSSEKTNPESLNETKKIPSSTQKRKKSKAPDIPGKDLPDMINELPSSRIPAKKIMDAVIKEMKNVKALDNHPRLIAPDYEIDSLERINRSRKQKKFIVPVEEKSEKLLNESNNNEVLKQNYYNTLPEFISQRPEGYSLVSEVYVNDGYASPANSDDSGPEIHYEPENPGHLTIKVQDSPENYVKQDESEYEPDTLDRKPMRLKINGDVIYEKDLTNENFVDSLERPPTQILLKSKGSFRDTVEEKNDSSSLTGDFESLRNIYATKFKSNTIDSNLMKSMSSLDETRDVISKESLMNEELEKVKYLTPDQRQARRQRKQNQPDVVPLPPPSENIYVQPKQPRRIDDFYPTKNVKDRSSAKVDNPTVSRGPPVRIPRLVGTKVIPQFRTQSWKKNQGSIKSFNQINQQNGKVEDSGYLSSTDSSESQKKLLKYEFSSVSETDDAESICDGAESESGAESVGTDSVFFGNFRKLSNLSNFSKSTDSGVDIGTINSGSRSVGLERQTSFNTSDSENESFVTVLPFGDSRRNSLVL